MIAPLCPKSSAKLGLQSLIKYSFLFIPLFLIHPGSLLGLAFLFTMAPGLVSDVAIRSEPAQNGTNGVHKTPAYPQPLKLSGALNEFKWEDATPVIGREFPTVNIVDDLMNASNADELLRDLAITSKYFNDPKLSRSYR